MWEGKPRAQQGALRTDGKRFAIIASRWNEVLVDKLVDGAVDALEGAGASGIDIDIEVFRCPGAFEIPGLARRVVDTNRFHGVICLGVVIRGATPHFDMVVGQATTGVGHIAREAKVAVGFGVLACENIQQATERAGGKDGNRGFDAAAVAIEMAYLYAELTGMPATK